MVQQIKGKVKALEDNREGFGRGIPLPSLEILNQECFISGSVLYRRFENKPCEAISYAWFWEEEGLLCLFSSIKHPVLRAMTQPSRDSFYEYLATHYPEDERGWLYVLRQKEE